jgi:hypothetical protein
MMIKRIKARHHSGTMVANPRRKVRNGKKRSKKRGLRSLFANPKHKRKHANPKHKRRNPLVRRKRRNPDVSVGGVKLDLVSIGVGSVAAIALGSIGQAVADKYLSKTFANSPMLQKALPNAIVAGAAFAAAKYMKNDKIKSIAKVTLVLSIFKMIDDSVGTQIKDSVKNVLPKGTSGYIPAVRQLSGVHMDSSGAYTYAGPSYTHGSLGSSIMPGANLYGL